MKRSMATHVSKHGCPYFSSYFSKGVYKRYLIAAMGEDRDVGRDRQKEGVSIRADPALELLSA